MRTKAIQNIPVLLQRKLRLLFTVFFISGLLAGAWLSRFVHSSFFTLFYAAGNGDVTLWSLAIVLLIPLLISFVAFYFNAPVLILPISFFKAVAFSFCSCCMIFTYGSAGWLVRFLLLFSDSAMLAVLCWYWLRHLDGDCFRLRQDTCLCLGFALAIGIIDYMYISPFAAMILQG